MKTVKLFNGRNIMFDKDIMINTRIPSFIIHMKFTIKIWISEKLLDET